MPTKKLIIKGNPQGQKRPRFFCRGKHIDSLDPDKQSKIWIKWQIAEQIDEFIKEAVEVHIIAYMPIPQSTSKKKIRLMLENIIKHIKKPDGDNIFKKYTDAMSGVAYHDDKLIWYHSLKKLYSEDPHVEITLIW